MHVHASHHAPPRPSPGPASAAASAPSLGASPSKTSASSAAGNDDAATASPTAAPPPPLPPAPQLRVLRPAAWRGAVAAGLNEGAMVAVARALSFERVASRALLDMRCSMIWGARVQGSGFTGKSRGPSSGRIRMARAWVRLKTYFLEGVHVRHAPRVVRVPGRPRPAAAPFTRTRRPETGLGRPQCHVRTRTCRMSSASTSRVRGSPCTPISAACAMRVAWLRKK
jgi:hypothetical protein